MTWTVTSRWPNGTEDRTGTHKDLGEATDDARRREHNGNHTEIKITAPDGSSYTRR